MANEEIKIRNVEHAVHVMTDLFLENGIEGTTKEMISRKSDLSRKSIDRYFYGKKVCVLQAAEWLGENVWSSINQKYSKNFFENTNLTGVEILKMYLADLKQIFISKPRLFVFYSEFKLYYARRDAEKYEERYANMLDTIGCQCIAEKIFACGLSDGTLKKRMDAALQAKYFCKSCFGFLSAMATDYEHQPEETISQIDSFVQGAVDLYCVKT